MSSMIPEAPLQDSIQQEIQQIKKEDHDEHECRMCFGTTKGNLISPCLCIGSIQYVHRQCLQQWRASNPAGFSKCLVCGHAYTMCFMSLWSLLAHPVTISTVVALAVASYYLTIRQIIYVITSVLFGLHRSLQMRKEHNPHYIWFPAWLTLCVLYVCFGFEPLDRLLDGILPPGATTSSPSLPHVGNLIFPCLIIVTILFVHCQ
eukprot:TRINITY_DN22352_c0_g1_i1.p1 TRINITY_DN22352_c0_g1~~TRINITY_DN22352_c0_g1_i1.p1  ORF type:complete len:204 (+),score=12.08 TRINITY_DN22352_c0_g1_i1:51-662(+)